MCTLYTQCMYTVRITVFAQSPLRCLYKIKNRMIESIVSQAVAVNRRLDVVRPSAVESAPSYETERPRVSPCAIAWLFG